MGQSSHSKNPLGQPGHTGSSDRRVSSPHVLEETLDTQPAFIEARALSEAEPLDGSVIEDSTLKAVVDAGDQRNARCSVRRQRIYEKTTPG